MFNNLWIFLFFITNQVISIEIIEWEHDQSFEASPVILIHGGAGYIPLDHFQAKV